MLKIDLTVTVSVILALCSIFSSLMITILNNRHQLKIKKMDIAEKSRQDNALYIRKVFENYLSTAGDYIIFQTPKSKEKYTSSYLTAILYASGELESHIEEINRCIRENDFAEAESELSFTASEMNKLLQKL